MFMSQGDVTRIRRLIAERLRRNRLQRLIQSIQAKVRNFALLYVNHCYWSDAKREGYLVFLSSQIGSKMVEELVTYFRTNGWPSTEPVRAANGQVALRFDINRDIIPEVARA